MSLESELSRHSALIEMQCKALELQNAMMERLSSALEKMFSAAVRGAKPSDEPAAAGEPCAIAAAEEVSATLAPVQDAGEAKAEATARRGRPTKAEQEAKAKAAAELEAKAAAGLKARADAEQAAKEKASPKTAPAEAPAPASFEEKARGMTAEVFRAECRKFMAVCPAASRDAAVTKIKAELSCPKIMDVQPDQYGRILWAFNEAKAGRSFSFEVFDEDAQSAGEDDAEEI